MPPPFSKILAASLCTNLRYSVVIVVELGLNTWLKYKQGCSISTQRAPLSTSWDPFINIA